MIGKTLNTLSARGASFTVIRWALGAAAWVAVVLIAPYIFTTPYHQGLIVTIGIDAVLALGLIVLVGYAGQFSLGQAAFGAIGAYGSAVFTVELGWSPLLAMIAAAVVAALVAYVVGRPILRLKGHFLAMATLAFGEILYLILTNSTRLGGSSGFGGIPPFSLGGMTFLDQRSQIYLVWALLGVGMWFALRIGPSRDGRGLRALRTNETVAAANGVNPATAKTKVFMLSAVYGSVGGSLYAHTLLYVNPSPFGVLPSVEILVMAVVGGLLSPWGAILGAGTLTLIRLSSSSVTPMLFGEGAVGAGEELVVGAVLILVLVLMPDGIVGGLKRIWAVIVGLRGSSGPVLSAHEIAAPTEELDERTPHIGPGSVKLSTTGMTKVFGGVTAVQAVDLVLHESEIIGVIGPNGAGKSTLINLVSGVLAPTSGRISLNGEDVTGKAPYDVAARGLARTFQTPVVFEDMTVLETVMVGTHLGGRAGMARSSVPTLGVVREERRLREEADELLGRFGLADLRDVEARKLSLGHQKILELARALARKPSVLLLDEPAAGLNRAEKQRLMAHLKVCRREGIALLLVEHDMEMVMGLADRVHVLDFGETLLVGTPDEARSDPRVVRAYLGVDDDEEEPADVSH